MCPSSHLVVGGGESTTLRPSATHLALAQQVQVQKIVGFKFISRYLPYSNHYRCHVVHNHSDYSNVGLRPPISPSFPLISSSKCPERVHYNE